MSSWQYAFLFPQSPNKLRPENGINCLTGFGAGFDSKIRLCVPIDEAGHLLDVGEEIDLKEPFQNDLIRFLQLGKSLSIQLRSSDLSVSCQFILESPNPHVSLGWSRHLLGESSQGTQCAFWTAIRTFAKCSNAAYVVILDDAPDYFEDRFIEIDSRRILDLQVEHHYGLGIREMWVQSAFDSSLPDGPKYVTSDKIGDGFVRYFVLDQS